MDGANDPPQTGDSSSNGSGSSPIVCNEVAAHGTRQARLVRFLKDHQSKSPEEAATILQQWQELKEQYKQKRAEFKQLQPEFNRLRHTMISHQVSYAIELERVPSIIDLDQPSAQQLVSLHQALEHDTKAGDATWKIYEVLKKMQPAFDAAEKMNTFQEEHFILGNSRQQALDRAKAANATARQYIKGLGPALVKARQTLLEF